MTAEKLTEAFAVKAKDADRAVAALTNDLMDARIEGRARTLQRPEFATRVVVESTEEVESPTPAARKAFAEAAGGRPHP